MASRLSSLAAVSLAALGLFTAASGCGPSLRRVHAGNVYFERCYAADLDALVPTTERRACWQAWHDHYQVGASSERIDHATERLAMLDPARADAIALATGSDPIAPASVVPATGLLEIVSSEPAPFARPTETETETSTEAPTSQSEPLEPAPPAPPTHEAPTHEAPTHEAIVEQNERERSDERRSHRHILRPRTTTPHCAASCQPVWDACVAQCSPDDHGCAGACRRELTVCSRGCY